MRKEAKTSWAADKHGLTLIENNQLIRVHPCSSAAQIVFPGFLSSARYSAQFGSNARSNAIFGLFTAEADEEDPQQNQAQAEKFLAGEGFLEKQAGPEQGPNISQRNHRVKDRQLAVPDP